MMAFPAETPFAIPEMGSMPAMDALLLAHVPPVAISARVAELPTHKLAAPVME